MPLYDYRCEACGTLQPIFKRIEARDVAESCDSCHGALSRLVSAPRIATDYEGYRCPITDKWIEGRRAHIENLKRHECHVMEPGEREAADASRQALDLDFERRVGDSIEAEIVSLPARKRESLASEMAAGLDLTLTKG